VENSLTGRTRGQHQPRSRARPATRFVQCPALDYVNMYKSFSLIMNRCCGSPTGGGRKKTVGHVFVDDVFEEIDD